MGDKEQIVVIFPRDDTLYNKCRDGVVEYYKDMRIEYGFIGSTRIITKPDGGWTMRIGPREQT